LAMTGVPYPSPLRGIEKAELRNDNLNVVGIEFVARRQYVTRLPRSGGPFEMRLVRSRLGAIGLWFPTAGSMSPKEPLAAIVLRGLTKRRHGRDVGDE
jgi:hypothetical protein